MARVFTATNYLEDQGWTAVTAAPFTVAIWFYSPADTDNDDCLFQMGNKDVSNHYWRISAYHDQAPPKLASVVLAGGATDDVTINEITLNSWQHACFIETSSTNRAIILNGDWANRGTNAVNKSPLNTDSIAIGYENDSSPGDNFEGDLAEVAIWSAALNQSEVEALAAGYSALFIRPASLVAYFPLIRGQADKMGISTMTTTGSVGVTAHPPILYPSQVYQSFAAAAAPPVGLSIPVAMHHYRQQGMT